MADLSATARRLARRAGLSDRPPQPWDQAFDHGPQPCPPGLVLGPPDFVGVGAQKAGTSWWFDLVVAHPAVYHHFGYDKERHVLAKLGAPGDALPPSFAADYASWFPRPAGAMTGEWTPGYLYYYWVAELLAAVAPACKVLVLVRDPVERYLSGRLHQSGATGVATPMESQRAFERGFYGRQLEPWEALFPADRLLLLQYERCCREPAAELARTYRFLGVDDDYRPDDLGEGHVPRSKPGLSPARRALLRERYGPDARALAARYPQLDLALWPGVA